MSFSKILSKRLLLILFFLASYNLLTSSDHIDGPVTTAHAVADITGLFAFPSPDFPGHLVLIMNVYPGVATEGHFSDKVTYDFWVRHASISGTGSDAGFSTTGDYQVTCSFETPHGINTPHWVTCKSTTGATVRVQVEDVNGLKADGSIRAFAGHRSDPFFFNAGWAVSAAKGKIDPPKDNNVMQDLNTLSIVLVIDIERELGSTEGSLFAIAATTTTQDEGVPRQIDRIGRPEITNITMTNNGREEIRDLYNAQKPFDLEGNNIEMFRQRLRDNIQFYDQINNTSEWTTPSGNQLAEILLNDFLVVDVSKPFTQATYFDIEYSILKGRPYTTCGGRVPNDDIIDVILTMLVNGGNEPMIRDGVDGPTRLASEVFPYLAEPTEDIEADIKSFIGRSGEKLTGTGKTFWMGIMGLLSGLLAVIGTLLVLYYLIREGIARVGKHENSDKKHPRLMFTVGLLFGIACILSLITGSFSNVYIFGFIIISIITFFLFSKWRKE
jgi:hypothetical protein